MVGQGRILSDVLFKLSQLLFYVGRVLCDFLRVKILHDMGGPPLHVLGA